MFFHGSGYFVGLVNGIGLIEISAIDALTVALLGRVMLMLVSLSSGFVFIFQDKLLKKIY